MAENPREGGKDTPVAQDDLLGEAARATGPVEGADAQIPAAEEGRKRPSASERGSENESRRDDRGRAEGEAAPGRDENQAGFVKDPDKRFRP